MLKPPPALVHHLREKRCVLFCGAGLSAWAKLPTWKTLLKEVVEQTAAELGDDSVLTELNHLLDADRLLDVADHCQEALGDRRFGNILSTRLRGASEPIPAPHRLIVKLPFSAVVTTNYDKLLERAYASIAGWPKTPTSVDVDQLGPLLFDDGFFILKAHGDIDRADSIVLTTRDYQTIIHSNQAFNAIFSAILLTKAILFVGYSLNDPDFRLLMDKQLTVFRGSVPERYALMSGVGKIESSVLWRTARIRVLPYEKDQHEHVLEFLQALHQQVMEQATKLPGAIDDRAALNEYVASPSVGSSKPVKAREKPRASSLPSMPQLSISQRGKQITATLDLDGVVVQGASEWLPLEKLAGRTADALSNLTKARLMGSMLAEVLPASVTKALEQLSAKRDIALRLSPELDLLPWEWLQVSKEFLALRNPVVRIPNAVTSSARGYPKIHSPVRVLLLGDPNREDKAPLPGASAEVAAIQELYGKRTGVYCKSLLGPEASFDNVAAELTTGRYNIVHFAGHAWFDDLEPFIFLSGTVKLQASELRSLLNPHPPAILFLNSHFTIFTPPGASSDSSSQIMTEEQRTSMRGQRGFTDAVSVAGVGCLIGSFSGSLEDTVAKQVGLGFHEGLLEGLPIAHSLHKALVAATPLDPANTSHISYAMSGYGDITLPPRAKNATAGD